MIFRLCMHVPTTDDRVFSAHLTGSEAGFAAIGKVIEQRKMQKCFPYYPPQLWAQLGINDGNVPKVWHLRFPSKKWIDILRFKHVQQNPSGKADTWSMRWRMVTSEEKMFRLFPKTIAAGSMGLFSFACLLRLRANTLRENQREYEAKKREREIRDRAYDDGIRYVTRDQVQAYELRDIIPIVKAMKDQKQKQKESQDVQELKKRMQSLYEQI